MNLIELVNQNVSKKMGAFLVGAYLIGQQAEFKAQALMAAVTIVYMVCQTLLDRKP